MSDRPTAKLPRATASEWKGWLLVAGIAFTPPGLGTAYVGNKVSENTAAIQNLRLAMEGGKVTEQRLGAVEKARDDHETRIRALEKEAK